MMSESLSRKEIAKKNISTKYAKAKVDTRKILIFYNIYLYVNNIELIAGKW